MAAESAGVKAVLQTLQPSPNKLLDRLRVRIDDSMLLEMAKADYEFEVEEHLAPLLRLRDTGEVPTTNWHPMEVLNLIRWSEPDDPSCQPGGQGERGHVMRAFACAALLRMGEEPGCEDQLSTDNDALIQLIDSALALGPELTEAAVRFLAWRLLQFAEDDWARLSFELGLLVLLASREQQLPAQSPSYVQHVISFADWILAEVPRMEEEFQDVAPGQDSLLQTEVYGGVRADKWRSLVRETLIENASPLPAELQAKLAAVARLAGSAAATRD